MTDLDELPRDPHNAFKVILESSMQSAAKFPANGNLDTTRRVHAISGFKRLEVISRRFEDHDSYKRLLAECRTLIEGSQPAMALAKLRAIEDLFLASVFDDHFVDQDDEENFNTMAWRGDDRASVLKSLSDLRNLITGSDDFDDKHKQRLLYWVAKAENETLKEKGIFATIIAAADEIIDLAGRAGTKGAPVVKLIQGVRTTTKKNVTVLQIEAQEKPKQIAPPSDEDKD